jgi:hypothetical protein
MNLDALLLRIGFLALPGIFGNRLYRILKGIPTQKDLEDVIDIVIFSVISYGVYGSIVELTNQFGGRVPNLNVVQAALDDQAPIVWFEVFVVTLIAVLLAFIASYLYKARTMNRLGQVLGVSSLYGGDVWDVFLSTFGGQWVFVRDGKLDLTYYGYVLVASDESKDKQVILKDVDVFSNSTGECLYAADMIYLSRDTHDLSIEVPSVPQSDDEDAADTDKTEDDS